MGAGLAYWPFTGAIYFYSEEKNTESSQNNLIPTDLNKVVRFSRFLTYFCLSRLWSESPFPKSPVPILMIVFTWHTFFFVLLLLVNDKWRIFILTWKCQGCTLRDIFLQLLMRWCFFLKEILISDAGAMQVTTDI